MTFGLAPAWAMGGLAIHSVNDHHLVDGTHYRLMTDPRFGLPMRPVHVDRLDLGRHAVDANEISDSPWPPLRHDVTWTDSFGRELLTPIIVTPDNPVTAHVPKHLFTRCIWMKVDVERRTGLSAEIFRSTERGNRSLGARDVTPLSLGASKIDGIVVSGDGVITGVSWLDGWRLALDIDWVEVNEMGLPRDNRARYLDPSPGSPLLKALQRVHRGAPLRLGLHDEPTAVGPSTASTTTPIREDAKAAALGLMAAEALDALLDDTSGPQHALEQSEDLTEGLSAGDDLDTPSATWKPTELIHTSMHDPAVARSLGFMDVELPEVFDPEPAHVVVYRLRSWWALDPEVFSTAEALSFLPAIPGLVVDDESDEGGPAPGDSPDGFPLFGLYTFAVAVGHAPPVRPAAPIVDPESMPPALPVTPDGLGPWLPADTPIARRQAIVDVRGLAPAASLAVAEDRGGVITGMNERIDVVGQDDGRALLLVPSAPANATEPGTGRLMHRNVPEDGLTIRVAQSDVFGRWSDWGTQTLNRKDRPEPPEPVVDMWYAMASPQDGTDGGPLWGRLSARVQVPPAASLAPGAHLLDHIRLTGDVGGHAFSIDVDLPDPAPAELEVEVPRPDASFLAVGQSVEATTSAVWVDTAGNESTESRPRLTQCVDPRAPEVLDVPPTLDWSAWPDATGRARVRLAWTPTGAQSRFRLYKIDEARIRHASNELAGGGDARYVDLLAQLDAAAERPARAQVLRDHHELFERDWFEGLTDEPLIATGGEMTFLHELSGSLAVLVGFKIVAESAVGVPADIDESPLWVWAVPERRGPQRPMLEIVSTNPDPPRAVTLRLRLSGDPEAAVRYRLRRSVVHSDPRRMPVAHVGDIVLEVDPNDPEGGFLKSIDIVDNGALAHDRPGAPTRLQLDATYSWTVEVQPPDLPGSTRPGAWSRPSPAVSTTLRGEPIDIDPPDLPFTRGPDADGSGDLGRAS